MVNVNYRRGRDKEYRICNKYKKEGYIAFRSAGSHSFADVVAIKHMGWFNHVVFVQSKPKSYSERLSRELYKKYRWINQYKTKTEFLVL